MDQDRSKNRFSRDHGWPSVGEWGRYGAVKAGPRLKPEVRSLRDQVEKGLYIKRRLGRSFGEIWEAT